MNVEPGDLAEHAARGDEQGHFGVDFSENPVERDGGRLRQEDGSRAMGRLADQPLQIPSPLDDEEPAVAQQRRVANLAIVRDARIEQ